MTARNQNKRQRAVALSYGAKDAAPVVVAAGAGHIAEKIIELANAHNIPLKSDESLATILSKLDVGFEIPPESYRAVADILAFLYRTDEKWRKRKESEGIFPTKREEKPTLQPQVKLAQT